VERELYSRTWDLQDCTIQRGGDGRTVEAYAAVFDSPTEIRDQHGHYNERIDRTAFNRTLSQYGASRTQVLYNHGLDNYGKSGGLASVPIGKAIEVKADSKGLLTITRYNKSDLANAVLESISNGDITGQSFRGAIYRSDPEKLPRARSGSPLPTVTRLELSLADYGPTPSPYYKDAYIVAVRSELNDEEIADFIQRLSANSATDSGSDDSLNEHSIRNLDLEKMRLKARMLFEGVE